MDIIMYVACMFIMFALCLYSWFKFKPDGYRKYESTSSLAEHIFIGTFISLSLGLIWPVTVPLVILYGICYLIAKYIKGIQDESDID